MVNAGILGRLCPEFVRVFNRVTMLLVDVGTVYSEQCRKLLFDSCLVVAGLCFLGICFIPLNFLNLNHIALAD